MLNEVHWGEPALAIAIRINCGPAVLGDVGSDQGLSFTVIGDTVNTTHRLQVLTRTLQTPLVLADALIAELDGSRTEEVERLLGHLRDEGEQVVRGRSTPVGEVGRCSPRPHAQWQPDQSG
jgi:adenylate cyclase